MPPELQPELQPEPTPATVILFKKPQIAAGAEGGVAHEGARTTSEGGGTEYISL